MKKGKRNLTNVEGSTTTHQYARTAERNIIPKRRMNVGNLKRTKTPALPTGNWQRAPEGARGP